MEYIFEAFKDALGMLISLDREMLKISGISFAVAGTSTSLATALGIPLGVIITSHNFAGKKTLITLLNALLALPTVVIGLLVYSFLTRQGPLGRYGLLFTPYAMIMGQFILASPIITALTISALASQDSRIEATALTLGASTFQSKLCLIREAKPAVLAAITAGFGRVFSEVGVSMMLGGNIRNYTRNITTAIAFQTSRPFNPNIPRTPSIIWPIFALGTLLSFRP